MGIEENVASAPDEARSGFLSSRTFAAVRVAVSLAIVAGLVYKLSPGEIADAIRGSNPLLLLAALALMLLSQLLVIAKWSVLLRARDVHVSAPLTARTYCIGNLLSNLLPGAISGDVYRVYRIQRDADARTMDVTMSVLYERASGYAAMTCLGALGAAFYYGNVAVGAMAVAGGAACAGVLALILPRMPFPAVPRDHFLRNLLAHRRELIAVYQMIVFSLLITSVYISAIALAGYSFGIHVSWWYWAFVTWIVAIALLAPITLGGLGVRESSYSGLLHRAGATAAQGASSGFALGLLLIISNALILLALELADRLGYPRPAQIVESPQPAKT